MTQEIPGTMLLDRAVLDDPYPFYLRLQTQAPVWRVPGTDVFAVTSYALLEEAATRVEDFSSNMRCLLYRDENGLPARLAFGDAGVQALATADPPTHGAHRRAVFPEFVGKRMNLLEPEIHEVATSLVERAIDRRNADFMAEVGNLVPITIVNRLIGFRNSNLDQLLQTAFDSTALVGGTLSQQQLFECIGRCIETQSWIADQLAAAAAEPGDDILTSIRNGVESGAFSAQEGTGILIILLAAGGESTTSLLGSAVRILADNAELQQKLRQQPRSHPGVRRGSAPPGSPIPLYVAVRPQGYNAWGGVDIPAGATVPTVLGRGQPGSRGFRKPQRTHP